jgi:hypothetical protein
MSADAGSTWEDISGNLPEAPANDLIVDPALDSTIYLATDFGVFVTRDLGENWHMLGDDLPNVPVVDLDFHQPTRTLVAATYGRSMYSFDVDQTVTLPDPEVPAGILRVYPNPANDELNCEINLGSNAEYLISDLSGKHVLNGTFKKDVPVQQIDISGINAGSYFLRIITGTQILTSKFTKL